MEGENVLQLIIDNENLPIFIDSNLETWSFKSYLRVYHKYMKIWVPLIADDSLVYRRNEENDSMTFTLSQFFGKKHRRICSQKHISLLLEIFHVAPDVHLCSSIGFTGQSQCWIRTWSYCLLQFSRPYKMCCMAKKNRHDVDKAVKSLKDVWKMLFRTIFFQIR